MKQSNKLIGGIVPRQLVELSFTKTKVYEKNQNEKRKSGKPDKVTQ
jgi:hypothetical protein